VKRCLDVGDGSAPADDFARTYDGAADHRLEVVDFGFDRGADLRGLERCVKRSPHRGISKREQCTAMHDPSGVEMVYLKHKSTFASTVALLLDAHTDVFDEWIFHGGGVGAT